MDMDHYQKGTSLTAIYPKEKALEYLALGLVGEAGEVAGKVKKVLRGDGALDANVLCAELGDVMWYIAQMADHLDLDLSDVAMRNLSKLSNRAANNTLKGDGDSR